MEYVDGGDLHQLWKDTGPFEEELIKLYIGELAITLGETDITSTIFLCTFNV